MTRMPLIRLKALTIIAILATTITGYAQAFTTPPRAFRHVSHKQQQQQQLRPSSSSCRHAALDPTLITAAAADLSLQNRDVVVFIAGVIPFAWATVEFWRRIAVGEPFGTGSDTVYIGKDNAPSESRGQQTLDDGAFAVAYVLFGLAAGAIGLTLYSVVTSGAMPEVL